MESLELDRNEKPIRAEYVSCGTVEERQAAAVVGQHDRDVARVGYRRSSVVAAAVISTAGMSMDLPNNVETGPDSRTHHRSH